MVDKNNLNRVKGILSAKQGTEIPKYNTGAKNKNVYSIGSEIPTSASVNTAGIKTAATRFLFSGFATLYIANAAPGSPANWNKIRPFVKLRTKYPVAEALAACPLIMFLTPS